MKFVIYGDAQLRWHWYQLTEANREVARSSKAHRSKVACIESIVNLKKTAKRHSRTAHARVFLAQDPTTGWKLIPAVADWMPQPKGNSNKSPRTPVHGDVDALVAEVISHGFPPG